MAASQTILAGGTYPRLFHAANGVTHTVTMTDIGGMPVAITSCTDGYWFTTCACETDTEGCVSP